MPDVVLLLTTTLVASVSLDPHAGKECAHVSS